MRWPKVIAPFPGPNARKILALDRAYMSRSLTRLYPFVADAGQGCWVSDVDGNVFLDFTAGIAVNSTGCSHPDVVAAIETQARRLLHFSLADFYNAPAVQLAAELPGLLPGAGGDARVFLCNSGAETIETALKLARFHTERFRLVAFHGAFDGRTTGAIALGDSRPVHKQGFGPLIEGVAHVTYSMAGLDDLEERLAMRKLPPEEVAAVFVEPIQGERGVILPEEGFLPRLRQICDRHGILLVADEVQTGMGRTGKMFACEHWGIAPDIVCTAKGIASGMPLGAVIARAGVMDWPGGTHASTFGGNPVSCAAALATIRLLKEGLIANAAAMGALILARLRAMAERFPLVKEVRGRGLLIGIELAREGRAATAERDALLQTAVLRGLLLLSAGESVARICPPLIVNRDEVEVGLGIFEAALNEVSHERKAA